MKVKKAQNGINAKPLTEAQKARKITDSITKIKREDIKRKKDSIMNRNLAASNIGGTKFNNLDEYKKEARKASIGYDQLEGTTSLKKKANADYKEVKKNSHCPPAREKAKQQRDDAKRLKKGGKVSKAAHGKTTKSATPKIRLIVAKKGTTVKKAKSGTSVKACKYGCK